MNQILESGAKRTGLINILEITITSPRRAITVTDGLRKTYGEVLREYEFHAEPHACSGRRRPHPRNQKLLAETVRNWKRSDIVPN